MIFYSYSKIVHPHQHYFILHDLCISLSLSSVGAAVSGPSTAVASHTSTRKKSLTGKTEGHEHKKSTGKKR